MKKLKALIIEDEIMAIELLKDYIQKIEFLELVGETRNPLAAFSLIQKHNVDVLFLDINMPVLNGIDLFKSLVNPPAVIFTTSYAEYAVEGFNLEAVDYLMKPISFPRFLKACHRLLKKDNAHFDNKINTSEKVKDFVYLKSGVTTYKMAWQDIYYLEKNENYVIYHSKEKRILTRQTLTNAHHLFPNYICRIHKTYAVSLLHITHIKRDSLQVQEKELPISRSYRDAFRKAFEAFNSKK